MTISASYCTEFQKVYLSGKERKSETLVRPSTLISNVFQTQNLLYVLAKKKHELDMRLTTV